MESEETQLLRTIRGEPNADTPRLVYADWLEENGRAERAEFIRLQCAIVAATDQAMSVGGEGQSPHRTKMTLERHPGVALLDIPQTDGALGVTAGQHTAIGTPTYSHDPMGVFREGLEAVSIGHVPQLDSPVVARTRQLCPVGRNGERLART